MRSRPLRTENGCLAVSSRRGRGQLVKGKEITRKGEKKTLWLVLQRAEEHSQQVEELHRKQIRAKGLEPRTGEAEALTAQPARHLVS